MIEQSRSVCGRSGFAFSRVGSTPSGANAPAPPRGSLWVLPETLPPPLKAVPLGKVASPQAMTEGVIIGSAAWRKRAKPSPSLLRKSTSPERGRFWVRPGGFSLHLMFCNGANGERPLSLLTAFAARFPFRGRWHGASRDGEGSARLRQTALPPQRRAFAESGAADDYPFRHRLRRCHLPQGDGFWWWRESFSLPLIH